jgi:tRNA U34 5-carboxymethylaminomethyl modifying GTPase MnmE/TrmE
MKQKYIDIKNHMISSNYLNDKEKENISNFIDEKLNNFNPTLMVYGVYNAGKSTLINALFGREIAKTGDIPQTSQIAGYEYKHYTIYDTPGINAPIAHEKLSKEHLNKVEIILFVISNDGSLEERYIYEEIENIKKLNKPIIVVLNNKAGIDMNGIDAYLQLEKVSSYLEDEDIFMVDALSAYDGKVENEIELIKDSKIQILEEKIDELLGKSGKKEIIQTLNSFLINYTTLLKQRIDMQIEDKELQKLEQLLTYLYTLKENSKIEFDKTIHQIINNLHPEIIQMILNQPHNVEEFLQQKSLSIGEMLNDKLKTIQDDMIDKIENFKIELQTLNIDNPKLKIDIIDDFSGNNNLVLFSTIIELLPPVIPIFGIALPLKKLSKIFFAMLQANQHQKAENNYTLAKNRADEYCYEYKKLLRKNVTESLEKIFKVIKEIENEAFNLRNRNDILYQNKSKVVQIEKMLNRKKIV